MYRLTLSPIAGLWKLVDSWSVHQDVDWLLAEVLIEYQAKELIEGIDRQSTADAISTHNPTNVTFLGKSHLSMHVYIQNKLL